LGDETAQVPKKAAEKKEETQEKAQPTVSKQGSLKVGMKLGSTFQVVKTTPTTVTIGSQGGGNDPGAKFSGKRYQFRWDGTGYKRGGKYIAHDTDSGFQKVKKSMSKSIFDHLGMPSLVKGPNDKKPISKLYRDPLFKPRHPRPPFQLSSREKVADLGSLPIRVKKPKQKVADLGSLPIRVRKPKQRVVDLGSLPIRVKKPQQKTTATSRKPPTRAK
jgi:hypothetical protein